MKMIKEPPSLCLGHHLAKEVKENECPVVKKCMSVYFVSHIEICSMDPGMCNDVVRREPYALEFIPDRFKVQEMCNKAVEVNPCILWHVPDHFIMQEMRAGALVKYLLPLAFVPDQNKTQKMCEKAVEKGSYNLKFVPESLRPKGCVKKPLKKFHTA